MEIKTKYRSRYSGAQFVYLDQNMEKIKNPNDVYAISTARNKSGIFVSANMQDGKNLQLTKPMSQISYPQEPIVPIYFLLGRDYWTDFGAIVNSVAINKKHLTGLAYIDLSINDPKSRRVEVTAYFDDGRKLVLMRPLKKLFFKKFKFEMEQTFGIQFEDITEEVKQQNELNQ